MEATGESEEGITAAFGEGLYIADVEQWFCNPEDLLG